MADVPNTLDDLWELDQEGYGAVALQLRESLSQIGKAMPGNAADIYRHRGGTLGWARAHESSFMSQQKVRYGKIFYRINRRHTVKPRGAN